MAAPRDSESPFRIEGLALIALPRRLIDKSPPGNKRHTTVILINSPVDAISTLLTIDGTDASCVDPSVSAPRIACYRDYARTNNFVQTRHLSTPNPKRKVFCAYSAKNTGENTTHVAHGVSSQKEARATLGTLETPVNRDWEIR